MTEAPQPPAEYLSNALDWIETHAVKASAVDWPALRAEALALAPNPATTADTYAALHLVTGRLADPVTWMLEPEELRLQGNFGLSAVFPEGTVINVQPGGAAAQAGVHAGDIVVTVDGATPRAWHLTSWIDFGLEAVVGLTLRRAGGDQSYTVTLERRLDEVPVGVPTGGRHSAGQSGIGYLDLAVEGGAGWEYPTVAQQLLRAADQPAACGWMIDVRHLGGGNLWSYLAAVGPIMGEGEVGGFSYADGTSELWAYRDGKVYWNDNERAESMVEGPIFQPQRAALPVALLTSRATAAAGELLVVAFQGRPFVRRFGETTAGAPFLQFHTRLSDSAFLTVSGALGMDRTGQVYAGPIAPDEVVPIDWTLFGTEQDPVITAALAWLQAQPECADA